jgi:hypothetical protein
MLGFERKKSSYDSDTIRILREALDDAWARLPSKQQMRTEKSALALAILRLASNGERDPTRLSALALVNLKPSDESEPWAHEQRGLRTRAASTSKLTSTDSWRSEYGQDRRGKDPPLLKNRQTGQDSCIARLNRPSYSDRE